MSYTLQQPLALGRTAEIYPWGDDQVLKLFHTWFSSKDIAYEQRISNAIHAAGIPVPAVGEMIRVDGRDGLIYQRLEGKPMVDLLRKRPWLVYKYAHQTAMLHKLMHDTSVQVDIPHQKEVLTRKIKAAGSLPNDHKGKLLNTLQRMPGGECLCHGDFHPGNILVSSCETSIIDWIDSTLGNPLADVARTTILMLGTADRQVDSKILRSFVRLYHHIYLKSYFHHDPGSQEEYRRWLPIVAAARLSEEIHELEGWLVDQSYHIQG